MCRSLLRLGIALIASGVPLLAATINFSFQTVINPGDVAFTQLLGINNASRIAGYFGDGTVVPNNGFTLILPNNFTPENFPGSVQTQVVGINNPGETVGFWIDGNGVNHGFTDIGGTFLNVSNPNTTTVTQLLGVNDSGEAAGYWSDAMGNFHPFTWVPGAFTPITFTGLGSAQATGVNNAGQVVGFNITTLTTDGFLIAGGVFTKLDFPGAVSTQALGLNNSGQVVGDYVDAAGGMHGFLYTVATASFQSIDDPNGVGTTTINGINDRGQLVGFYVDANGNTDGFVATAVPEPESLTLILIGTVLAAVSFIKLRKNRE
jgi:hypothetical protein